MKLSTVHTILRRRENKKIKQIKKQIAGLQVQYYKSYNAIIRNLEIEYDYETEKLIFKQISEFLEYKREIEERKLDIKEIKQRGIWFSN